MTRKRKLMGSGTSPALATAIVGSRSLIASTGTGSVDNASVLAYDNNFITSSAGLDSFVLPSTVQGSQIGDILYTYVRPGQSVTTIYAASGETVNGAASVTQVTNKLGIFKRFTATEWGNLATP